MNWVIIELISCYFLSYLHWSLLYISSFIHNFSVIIIINFFSGLPVPAVPAGLPSRPRKTPVKKLNDSEVSISQDGESSSESGDDSDEDWVPGSEEVRRRNKMMKRFIPG